MTPPIEFIEDVYDRHRELRGRLAGISQRRLAAAGRYQVGMITYDDLDHEYQQITIDEYSILEAIAECERWML
tara:strand:+ start:60 stop:278 length:219 start_codon:yes stop_codon:yes gene_type:complete